MPRSSSDALIVPPPAPRPPRRAPDAPAVRHRRAGVAPPPAPLAARRDPARSASNYGAIGCGVEVLEPEEQFVWIGAREDQRLVAGPPQIEAVSTLGETSTH